MASKASKTSSAHRIACVALAMLAAAGLTACDSKEKKPGQALASVNGDEITVLQLNEELQRSGASAAQQETASRQLLESLIDRQLLQSEAAREKLDRDPKVMQAIERAKAQIIAQSYLQKRVGTIARPDKAELTAYYEKNPSFFSQRKTFDIRQLVLASSDFSEEARKAADGFKSLDDAASWLEGKNIRFARAHSARATSDLPPDFSAKLLSLPKGQIFIVREGERTLVNVIADVKDTPLAFEAAAPQIEQFLYNQKVKAASDAEIARLRGIAKIEYLNKNLAPKAAASASASASASAAASEAAPVPASAASASASASSSADEATARGVAGLK